jgi:hypothetical protein
MFLTIHTDEPPAQSRLRREGRQPRRRVGGSGVGRLRSCIGMCYHGFSRLRAFEGSRELLFCLTGLVDVARDAGVCNVIAGDHRIFLLQIGRQYQREAVAWSLRSGSNAATRCSEARLTVSVTAGKDVHVARVALLSRILPVARQEAPRVQRCDSSCDHRCFAGAAPSIDGVVTRDEHRNIVRVRVIATPVRYTRSATAGVRLAAGKVGACGT